MASRRLTGDYARTTIGANPGIDSGVVYSLTADTTAGSRILINASTAIGLVAGQTMTGAGISEFTTIDEISGTTILLSQNATATASAVALSVAGATQVLGLVDWAITFKVKTVDATTTDEDGWEDSLPSSASWTARATYVYLMGDPSQAGNVRAILNVGNRNAAKQWNFFLDSTSGDDSFTGRAYITGLGVAAAVGNTIRMDVTLKGVGPVTLRNQATYQASLILPTGSMAYTIGRTLGNYAFAALWSNFLLIGTLPPDAVITGIYPVIIASANYASATQILKYGAALSFGELGSGTSVSSPSPAPAFGASFSSTEFYGTSIGTDLSVLASQEIQTLLASSLELDVMTDTLTITGVGFAIYYSSILPAIYGIMPPPFAVPAGQGLAWALPFAVIDSGGPYNNGLGLIGASSGEGLGTPAIGEV